MLFPRNSKKREQRNCVRRHSVKMRTPSSLRLRIPCDFWRRASGTCVCRHRDSRRGAVSAVGYSESEHQAAQSP
jgi:hypothetical protein